MSSLNTTCAPGFPASIGKWAPALLGLLLAAPFSGQAPAAPPAESSFQLLEEIPLADAQAAELTVEVQDTAVQPRTLPVRALVTASDGSHPDGSGNGTYADGRFFAEGHFTVRLPPGQTKITLRCGPNYLPLEMTIDAPAGKQRRYRASLQRWFAPEERGWYSGDNHVHAQHDAQAVVKTSLAYTALQARANGLNWITEAGSAIRYDDKDRLDRPTFLFRHAQELRPGPFVGHLNTPGIRQPIPKERYEQLIKRPLPAQAVIEAVHELQGVVIHTHPLTPPHQLHWMGAAEFYADAVLGRCADALDLDSRASEVLWFTALNLGNQVACSSYTDCALGRLQTLSPGDRRVYAHAREFTYPAIVEAIRQGKTFASNGGPLFPFFTIDGREPGATIRSGADGKHEARLEVHSLYPLKSAQLYRRGALAQSFEVGGKKGQIVLTHALRGPAQQRDWVVARVEDERGHWAITSPVYLTPAEPAPPSGAAAVLLAIGNHTRFVQLRRDFFAHLLVTVSPDDALQEVELLQDGRLVRSFRPAAGNRIAGGKIPVTGIDGAYEAGWMWYRQKDRALHFQADLPVQETAWYAVRARTVGGRAWTSDALHYDAANDRSHVLSMVRLAGGDTEFVLQGYGEEMPLADIRQPFAGDHWWYPQGSYWQLQMRFGAQAEVLKGGDGQQAKRFRGRPSE